MTVENFFAYSRERHSIYLRRQQGLPRSEWTQDPILREYRFCNIYRELDTTTIHLRKITNTMRDEPEVLLATVVYRWFNRIQTCDAIFNQDDLIGCVNGCTAWESLLNFENTGDVKRAILNFCKNGPYVTGSYIIKTPNGQSKLDGVLWCIDSFMKRSDWRNYAEKLLEQRGRRTLQEVWDWLRKFHFMGDFMAYEVVTDLRHTDLLDRANDIKTWANPGPGAMRGLNRIAGRDLDRKISKKDANIEMFDLLTRSMQPDYWPQEWSKWEMREVEHTLCEFDKYERVRFGQGAPRQKFR